MQRKTNSACTPRLLSLITSVSFITKWSGVLLESFHVALRRRRYVVKRFNVGKMNRRGSGEKISLKNICLHTDLALKSAWRSFWRQWDVHVGCFTWCRRRLTVNRIWVQLGAGLRGGGSGWQWVFAVASGSPTSAGEPHARMRLIFSQMQSVDANLTVHLVTHYLIFGVKLPTSTC